ncbi:MAG: DUF1572 family protein [Ginsengibacter sp.]
MDIATLFERDLNKLVTEINLYNDEKDLWKIKEGISNSAGNLALHLIGNLNYFIGTILDDNHYVRDRDKEFSEKNIPRTTLVEELQNIIPLIKNTLPKIAAEALKKDFPVPLAGNMLSTEATLVYLLAHFNYHLGQVNYHRRILDI